MSTYHKIDSLFKRDMSNNGKLIIGNWAKSEFEYLQNNEWEWTEKIDGTNIRIIWDGTEVEFGGRTDRANIQPHLLEYLKNTFTAKRMANAFGNQLYNVVLYGEGYGKKIQHGHNYISDGVGFILFDIRVGRWWLERDTVEALSISTLHPIKIVPTVGEGSLSDAISFVSDGFTSLISENREYQAEGVVARPIIELSSRSGNRIITKIKTIDFKK